MKAPVFSQWRNIQKENFRCLEKLGAFLELDSFQKSQLAYDREFSLNLPCRLARKITKKTLNDPILRQFVPLKEENEKREGFVQDPVGDHQALLAPRCLQKYAGRALIITTGACAMHCRFCFRQKFDYNAGGRDTTSAIEYIRKNSDIQEAILSGGDPLSLSNSQLEHLLQNLAQIKHLKRIRFHTRFPIGIPERLDDTFLALLEACPKQIWFVIHCNHPIELDEEVLASLKKVQKLGIPVLNQWVLLKGINDSIEVLQDLCEKLVAGGIFPYYLHQLDRVDGTAHFEVCPLKGKELIEELNRRLSGYGIPKYVREIPNQPSKIEILH